MKRKYLLGMIILLLAVAGGAYYFLQRDYRNDIKGLEPDVSLTAETLYQDYSEDEEQADGQYLGKVLAVSGVINTLEISAEAVSISLDSGDPMGSVVFEMNQSLAYDWSSLSEGQQVVIKGECSGKLLDVIIVNGVIESV